MEFSDAIHVPKKIGWCPRFVDDFSPSPRIGLAPESFFVQIGSALVQRSK
jgi:hypothetical protein